MPVSINFDEIKPQLSSNSLILTPNSRTQKAVISGYMNTMSEGVVVKAPDILSLSQWQDELWQSLSFYQVLPRLVGNLELKIWLKELIATESQWQLTNILGVAEKVLDAYQNLCFWDKTLEQLGSLETPENQYFVKWCSLLESFCEEKQLLANFKKTNYLIKHFHQLTVELTKLSLPEKIFLIGFNQINPLENKFLQLCEQHEIEVIKVGSKAEVGHVSRVELTDFNQELEFAAAKSHQLAQQNPQASIGIVVQQLANNLPLIHQVFSEYYQPDESSPWQTPAKKHYNISAGQPLIELPLVDAAIKILQLDNRGFDLKTLSFLKNSPFISWGVNSPIIKRFLYEQSLLGFSSYSLSYLLNAIKRTPDTDSLQILHDRLCQLQNRELYQRPISAWVDHWKSHLITWGWLTEESTNETDNKIKAVFYDSMKQCLGIRFLYDKLSQNQAKDYLLQNLRQSVFQLPSDRTNIHLLGVLEAAGLEFDELILVGFNRDNWPQKNKVNPFLPIGFQQKYDFPGSSAEREYEYAKDITRSLLLGAEHILITQAQSEDQTSTESAFFSQYKKVDAEVGKILQVKDNICTDYNWRLDQNIRLEEGEVKGGAYLLSQYAACPFRAMSSFQLRLKAPQQPQKGIEPKIKGAWLHLVMEVFWNKVKNQKALLLIAQVELEKLVLDCIVESELEFDTHLKATTSSEVIDLEIEKMQKQILEWLEIDKGRAYFEVATEVEKSLQLSGLKLKLRIDRIDNDEQGNIEIIDYKTGNVDVKKWLGPRPEEAQMPAYVIACNNQSIQSLSYAKIKTGEVLRSGVWFNQENQKSEVDFTFIDQSIEGTKNRTKYLLAKQELIDRDKTLAQQWQENLEAMADKILSGAMPVSPKNKVETCRYCEFTDFCRIQENQPEVNSVVVKSQISNTPSESS